ncbi:MAG: DNA polymerase IV [Phyllobacterium sp.]
MHPVNDPMFGFCRDCLTPQVSSARRCIGCGSPRVVRHAELYELPVAHVDCDAFYASIEKRDNPDIRDKPVIIGGEKRGVVSTACYIARIHGVRSAMPMFKALEACPDAIVIKPNMEKYVEVGRQVRQMMLDLTPLVEPLSIDEAFLDLSGTERLHHDPPARVLARFAQKVEAEIGITVSVGLSYCKFLAKVGSDLEKPRGFSVIGKAEAMAFLRERPVTTIWGVGRAFAATLEKDGIRTIGQLQTMDEGRLMKAYGTIGQRLYRLSRGIDARRIEPRGEAKSVSSETTFNEDIADLGKLTAILRRQSERVSRRLKASNISGRTVVLKLKTRDFKLRTRNRQLGDPTQLADKIFRVGLALLEKEVDGTKFRLLGIGVSDLDEAQKADPLDLVDTQATKRAVAETAMDRLRTKFGNQAIETGYTFAPATRDKNDKNTK